MTSPSRDRAISIVLPIYRNRPQLPELHRRLTEALSGLGQSYQLVFVDDAAGDGSLEWLRECAARDAHVALVEMTENSGQHRAVLAGLKRATGDILVVMDADLQDRPEDIPRLVHALGETRGVVFARRTGRHQSRSRHVTGLIFKRLLRWLAGSRVPPGSGMFWAASKDVVQAVLSYETQTPYIPLMLDHTGAPMAAIDVVKELRRDTKSSYSLGRRISLAVNGVRQAIEWRRTRR